jgi:hypothetical protein
MIRPVRSKFSKATYYASTCTPAKKLMSIHNPNNPPSPHPNNGVSSHKWINRYTHGSFTNSRKWRSRLIKKENFFGFISCCSERE